jgi:hypothetical protein
MRKRLKMPRLVASNKCFARRPFSLDAEENQTVHAKEERRWTLALGRNIYYD